MGCSHSTDEVGNASFSASGEVSAVVPGVKPDQTVPNAEESSAPFHPDPALEQGGHHLPPSPPAPLPAANQSAIAQQSLHLESPAVGLESPMWLGGTPSALQSGSLNPLSPPLVVSAQRSYEDDAWHLASFHEGAATGGAAFAAASTQLPAAYRSAESGADNYASDVPEYQHHIQDENGFPALDPAHDEESALDAARGPQDTSHAITMDELPGDMHLRRIEGRGNMARMHGYTADIHQFPTPPPLTGRDRRAVERKCRRWLRRVVAHQPEAASV